MSKKLFGKFFIFLLVVGLLFAAAPTKQALAQTPTTLNVAKWSATAPVGVTGRPSVLFDGTTYHMWYGVELTGGVTELYYTTSTTPGSFSAGTKVTFDIAPLEQSSVTVIKEADGFKMITYGLDNKTFALYTSTNGTTWTKGAIVFDATSMTDLGKIDAPFVFNDGGTFNLYFQKKSADGQRYDIYLATSGTVGGTYALANSGNPVLSPTTDAWDGKFVMHPWVVKDGTTYYMWYSAHNSVLPQRIGLATSTDGINWTKSPANPVIGSVGEPSVIKIGDTWHMWYLGSGSAVQHVSATGPFEFQTIQAAIDAATSGDTINIAAGEYVEDGQIIINKNLTIVGADKATTIIKPAQNTTNSGDGRGWFLVNSGIEFNLSNVTLDGQDKLISQAIRSLGTGTINNINVKNIRYEKYIGMGIVMMGGNMTISNNTLSNIERIGIMPYGSGVTAGVVSGNTYIGKGDGDNLDYGIEVGGGAKVTISGNNISGIGVSSTAWSNAAIMVTDAYPTGSPAMVTITHNDLSDNYQGINVGYGTSDGVIVTAKYNDLSGTQYAINTTTDLVQLVDASPNWFGSAYGPSSDQIDGNVGYSPWCADPACTTFSQEVGVVELSGTINIPGGILVTEPGLTYHLAAGIVIQNNSPCFVIKASNTIIEAEPGAKCIPTGGSNGIDVAADLSNITIDGLEIDGSGQETGDGIHFAGAISDFVLADNFIHDLDGDGIEFAGAPTGEVDIAGNLFQNNTGLGINAGSYTVKAEYNSWGNVAGAAAGDGASGSVDADPFTHADVTLSPINTDTTSRVVTSLANVSGRPTVLKDGTLYHLWYGPTDTTLYHSVSTNPAEFPAGELVTFSTTTPLEVASTAIFKESETFYMVAYDGASNQAFALYSSADGSAWTYVNQVFNATSMPDLGKIDAPFVFKDGTEYKLYFQKKNALGDRYHIYLASSATLDGAYTLHATNPVLSPSTDVAAWDGKFVMHPWVVNDGTTYYMWFSAHNGTNQRIGLATSTNGIDWTKSAANPVIGPLGEPTVIKDGDIWRMWHLAGGNKINYLTALNPLDLRQTLAYQVSANLVNVNAADVTITYPADLLTIAELTSGTDLPGTFDTSVPGQISFVGYTTEAALTKQGAVLFNVTFHTTAQGTGDISFGLAEFGMPGYLSSSNVYLAAAVDTAEVEIKELPFLATDLDSSYYLTGEAQTFTVTITNYGTAYTGAVLNLTLPEGVTVTGVPATIDLAAGASQTLTLTFTSTPPGEKTIGFDLKDSAGELLFSTVETATVYSAPTITATFPNGPYVAGVPVTVPIGITNPDGIPGPFALVLNLPAGTTIEYGGNTYTCTETGCPPIPVTLPITTADLVITFPGGWTGDIIMNLYDTSWEPDRLLATFTKTGVTVLGAFDVNGTVSMQGRSARAGVPLTLTGPVGFAYGPYYSTSTALISNNYVFEDVAAGTYTFMTTQPRYLNIGNYAVANQDVTKSVTVEGAMTLSSLWLRGGNAIYTDNVIDNLDLGKVGLGYTAGITSHPDADVNFDGKINIQDLALVAGNYDLTSATAYVDWQP